MVWHTFSDWHEKSFTKIEAHAGMAEYLMIYLAIEDDIKTEIKYKIAHKNQSCVKCLYLS